MGSARRDFLKFAGGAVVGVGVSPVPWKLLDDSSIWTQNWSWTPKLARGDISFRPAACTLCPRGCAVSVRCVGGQPVGVKPRAGSALCPQGFTVHQASYRPARIRRTSVAADEAIAFVKDAVHTGQTIAIVDPAPGRVTSNIYRTFVAATPKALYIADPAPRTLLAYEQIAGLPFRSAGVALTRVRTLIAVEAPVLERWGPPGLLMKRRGEVRIVYAGNNGGVTAELADQCVPVSAVSRLIAEAEKPAFVIGGEHLPWDTHLELAAMNKDLGAMRIRREWDEGAAPAAIGSIPDGSIGVLIVDGSGVPLALLRPKMRPDCVVIAISAFANEFTAEAKFTIPAPAPLEGIDDIPAAFDSEVSSFRIASAIVEGGTGMSAGDFVSKLNGGVSVRQAIEARVAAIHASQRGSAKGTKLEDFETMLQDGGVWMDGGVA